DREGAPQSCRPTGPGHRTRGWGACAGKGFGVTSGPSGPTADADGGLSGTDTPPPDLSALEAGIGFTFRDPALLTTALTHSSFANGHPEDPLPPNERLEFLGDAVLGMIVAEALYTRFPAIQEGRLTEWRAQLVCGPTLARVAADQL